MEFPAFTYLLLAAMILFVESGAHSHSQKQEWTSVGHDYRLEHRIHEKQISNDRINHIEGKGFPRVLKTTACPVEANCTELGEGTKIPIPIYSDCNTGYYCKCVSGEAVEERCGTIALVWRKKFNAYTLECAATFNCKSWIASLNTTTTTEATTVTTEETTSAINSTSAATSATTKSTTTAASTTAEYKSTTSEACSTVTSSSNNTTAVMNKSTTAKSSSKTAATTEATRSATTQSTRSATTQSTRSASTLATSATTKKSTTAKTTETTSAATTCSTSATTTTDSSSGTKVYPTVVLILGSFLIWCSF